MNRLFITAFCLTILVIVGVASAVSGQTVSGSIGNGTVARGGTARGTVVLSIPAGLHVNSNRPDSEYAIPTSVRVTTIGGSRVSGVTYPRGKNKKFQFSNDLINVYDGRVSFPFTVTVPRGFRGNVVRVRAVVRFQACTDEVCYAPRSQEVTLTARIR
ncbi:MAG: hypothetical protein H0V76_10065 [Blastocatellia bacterium]|nr:hypothetical protein [Blastocatellia bacterium]